MSGNFKACSCTKDGPRHFFPNFKRRKSSQALFYMSVIPACKRWMQDCRFRASLRYIVLSRPGWDICQDFISKTKNYHLKTRLCHYEHLLSTTPLPCSQSPVTAVPRDLISSLASMDSPHTFGTHSYTSMHTQTHAGTHTLNIKTKQRTRLRLCIPIQFPMFSLFVLYAELVYILKEHSLLAVDS